MELFFKSAEGVIRHRRRVHFHAVSKTSNFSPHFIICSLHFFYVPCSSTEPQCVHVAHCSLMVERLSPSLICFILSASFIQSWESLLMLLNMGNNPGKSSPLQGNIQSECTLRSIRVNAAHHTFLTNMFRVASGDAGNSLPDAHAQESREA